MNEAKTFEWGGAVFTVSPGTGRTYFTRSMVAYVLQNSCADENATARFYYPRVVAQTTIDGNIKGWEKPDSNDEMAITQSFKDWLNLPEDLFERWIRALIDVDAPTAEPELQPDYEDTSDPKD